MNTLVRPVLVKQRLAGVARRSALRDIIVVGMPQLSLAGLSETWLLKECGHRHWLLLAEAAGLAVPDFRNADGRPIYAAFLAVSVREAAFDLVREHDELVISSRLVRSSGSQCTSMHRISIGMRQIGEIAMTSTFVKRRHEGRNHLIARVTVPGLRSFEPDAGVQAIIAECAKLRSDRWDAHLGLERQRAAVVNRLVIDACPSQDFNGADFLYFTSFQAFVDRAEWAFFRQQLPLLTTRRRDIVYRGNIDPGERVAANLLAARREDGHLVHWYRLESEHDRKVIADVFTIRNLSREEGLSP